MNRTLIPTADRLLFFDMVRNLAMLSVVLYHAVAAYSTVTPHWSVHDGSSATADMIRRLFDVFMMPIFFFVAGYFAVPSLARQGSWRFLAGKFRRIGIPWLLAILVIVPMTRYFGQVKAEAGPSEPFLRYWITYLGSVGTFQIGQWTPERMNQMHFWFLSLLLTFFIALGLFNAVRRRAAGPSSGASPTRTSASNKSIVKALLVTVLFASAAYFVTTLMAPDMSWVTFDLLWQFQPGGLILYVTCFALGGFAYSRQWFAGDGFPDYLSILAPVGILLTATFFLVGRGVFADPANSNFLHPATLLAFSAVRTCLCLAILVAFIAYACRYWNRPSRINQNFAANSYNIYLCHIFFVAFFQDVLMIWPGGPAMVKAAIVFLVVLPISYGIGRAIDRFPRSFVIGFVLIFVLLAILKG